MRINAHKITEVLPSLTAT